MAEGIFIIDIGPDGITATHPFRSELPRLVAPVPDDRIKQDFNTVRGELVAIGCMKLNEKPGFEFDSSLLGPGAEGRFTKFAELMKKLSKQDPKGADRMPPVSVFGHADPTGDPDYNKKLSGRRAKSVYGCLTRNVKMWDSLYLNPFGGDQWGYRAIQTMLSISLKDGEDPFFTGEIDGAKTAASQKEIRDALKAYQEARGLPPTGFANDATRAILFKEYMDAICHDADGVPFVLDPVEHFIAKQKDKTGLKGDIQGCSEFNPVFLPTKEDQDRFDKDTSEEGKEERNSAFATCRRVLVYIFRHDSEIDPVKWPCPLAETGAADCRKRFWSDSDNRLRRDAGTDDKPAAPRKFEETRDTMACRFYHAFAFLSPCEAGVRRWRVRFRVDPENPTDDPQPLRNRRFAVKVGSTDFAPVMRGRTDDDGEIVIPVFDDKTTITVRLDAWGALFELDPDKQDPEPEGEGKSTNPDAFPDEDTFMIVTLDAGALKPADGDTKELGAKQRLYNLGFGKNPPEKWTDAETKLATKQYRRTRNKKRGVTEGDALDDVTIESLRQEHDVEGPPPPEEPDPDDPKAGGDT